MSVPNFDHLFPIVRTASHLSNLGVLHKIHIKHTYFTTINVPNSQPRVPTTKEKSGMHQLEGGTDDAVRTTGTRRDGWIRKESPINKDRSGKCAAVVCIARSVGRTF